MRLILNAPKKQITIKDKTYNIRRLGLKHYGLIKQPEHVSDALSKILESITKDKLSNGEAEYIIMHILEFNGKLKSSVVKDGFEFDINDCIIATEKTYKIGETEYHFRKPYKFEIFDNVIDLLEKTYKGNDKPDFIKFPAFVIKWSDEIRTSLILTSKCKKKTLYNLTQIMEIFGNGEL